MDEALIVKKIDDLSSEIRNLKTEVQELRTAQPSGSIVNDCIAELDDDYAKEDLNHLIRNLLNNVETLNSLFRTVKGAMEFKEEIEPIAKLGYPMAMDAMTEVSEGLDPDQIKPLIRNTLANLENFNSAITMLKAAMELKDDIEPLAKLAYPMALETVTEVSENLDMEQVKPLIRNALSNLENFNSALTMLKAAMELKDDIEPLAKLSLPVVIDFFTEISGLMRVSGCALESVKKMQISPAQAEAMSQVIRGIDLSKPNKIGLFGMLKKINEPKTQEALGAAFVLLETFGSLLEAYRIAENK